MKTVGIVMLQLLAVYSVHSAYIPVPDRVPGINTRFLRPGGNDCTFCYNGGILVNDACLCPANYGPPCCSEVDGAIDEIDLEDIEVNRDGDLANRLPDNWEIIREQEEQAARRADDDQPQVLLPYVDDAHLNRRGEELDDQLQVLLPYVDDAHLNRRGQELDDQLQVLLPYVDDAHLNIQKEEELDDQPQVLLPYVDDVNLNRQIVEDDYGTGYRQGPPADDDLPYGQRHLNAEGQRVFDPPHLSLLPYIPEGANYRRDGDVPPADQPQVLLPYVDNRQAQQDDQEPEIAWEDDDDWAEFYGEKTELLEEDEQTEERRVLLEGRPPLQRPVAANKESVKWQDRPDISLYGGRRY